MDRAHAADVAALTPLLVLGQNCWRIEQARRFRFIVDAAEYFLAARDAMMKAKRRIFLIGWDFDPRIKLTGEERPAEGPETLGEFMLWLADRTPSLEILLLRWDTGAIKAIFRGNTLTTLLRWKSHPRISLKLDAVHPIGGSHHQKVLVIDDAVAFCGGIDMTVDRWDRRDHADDNKARTRPDGSISDPWHDATSLIDGEAARALGDMARERWQVATGASLSAVSGGADCWPLEMEPSFENVRVGIARTIPETDKTQLVQEIERLYLDLIARAKRWIYVENQYFASRKIARAIAQRLQEDDGPEIVLVNPHTSEGWIEPIAMDSARARLVESLRQIDRHQRFRIYHPQTTAGRPIYVHAKVVIVDDDCLRVGSSNFNNRSMGLDTECDIVVSAADAGESSDRGDAVIDTIASLRNDLIAEHLAVEASQVAAILEETGSLIAVIERLRTPERSLIPYVVPELSGTEQWLADNQILDPDVEDDPFEALTGGHLLDRMKRQWARVNRR